MASRYTRFLAAGGTAAALAIGGAAFATHTAQTPTAYAQAAPSGTASPSVNKAGGPGGDLKTILDQLVGQNKLNATQENDILAAWQQYQQQHPRGDHGFGRGPGGGFFGSDSTTVATALKLTPDQLKQQVQSGKSIAQIAQAQNVSLQAVQDAIIAAAKSRFDQDVAAGRMTSDQETQRLNDLKTRIPQRLTATPGQFPRGGRPGAQSTPGA